MQNEIGNINKILLLMGVLSLPLNTLLSQHVSKDNYTGDWETPASWNPEWPQPQSIISGYNITINGYITANSSLDFTGAANNLIINDTLVIHGNLKVNNNNQIFINDNGILIVRGVLTMENQSSVIANGYFVITDSLNKTSSVGQGSFTSNDIKPKVFIGGSIVPAAIINNRPDFPVLNCTSPVDPYLNSSCSYGNITDLMSDPIYVFLKNTCPVATASSNSPVCEGSAISLTASNGAVFSWSGPGSFSSTLQNPSISTSTESMEGTYSVTVTSPDGCTSTASTSVIVNSIPTISSPATGVVCSESVHLYDITSVVPGTTFTWGRAAVSGITNTAKSGQTSDPINEILINNTTDPVNVVYLIDPIANGCPGPEFSYVVTVKPVPLTVITNPLPVCSPALVDLTAEEVTAGSKTGLTFTYWTDPVLTTAYVAPDSAKTGTYYIKATDPSTNCFSIKPVVATVNSLPVLAIADPKPACSPDTIDLTSPGVTTGSNPDLELTYWLDAEATRSYTTPEAATAGTYYIKGTDPVSACYNIKPVTLIISPSPEIIISDPAPVCSPETVDLTATQITEGSTSDLIFSYWTDLEATAAYVNPESATEGTWYIKGTTSDGCSVTKPVTVVVNTSPALVIHNPSAVCSPLTVDITAPAVTSGSTADVIFTYWDNSDATIACTAPASVTAGIYYIKGVNPAGCYDIKPVTVTVNPLPSLTFTSSSDPICIDEKRTLTAIPAGGTFIVEEGPGNISGNLFSATGTGSVRIAYNYSDICTNKVLQIINVTETPVPVPGPDQELIYVFETFMAAELPASQTGEWSLVSGSGQISDINSPVTKISGLKVGENSFNWKVRSGLCEADAGIVIKVSDLFIPSVITPNGDGKNDYFKINALNDRIELIIMNRWGSVEYTNNNYQNDWDGRNNSGTYLSNDTYYYILKFENGLIRKGTVLITR